MTPHGAGHNCSALVFLIDRLQRGGRSKNVGVWRFLGYDRFDADTGHPIS